MFTDIVGYTALMARDEKKAFEVLRLNLQIHQTAIEEFHGTLVKEMGDGILASFPTVSDALSAAIRIQKQCNKTGEFKLSIGIHHGEVVVEKGDIFGDAVNIASRIRALGTAGSVLFSDKVADEIKNKAEFQAVPLGRFELKNVPTPVQVFGLGNAGFPVPKRSSMEGGIRRPGLVVSISAIILLLLGGYAAWNYEKWLPAPVEKSIVVLPFRYVSTETEKGSPFLAEGFATEISNRLLMQKNLRVIAREAAEVAHKEGWTPEKIREKLGIQYILSGSFQKDGDQLRVTTQLTDAETGNIVDAKTLNRKINGYLDLQKEIAMKVVRDVGFVASKGLEAAPGTDNIKAIEYFRRSGNYSGTTRVKAERDSIILNCHKALAQDSFYLQPLYFLTFVHFYMYDVSADSGHLNSGLQALRRMQRIDKSSIPTQNSEALYSYYVLKDYALAIQQLNDILRLVPYNSTAITRKGLAYRRWGKYQEYLDTYTEAAASNPLISQQPGLHREIGQDLLKHGQVNEAWDHIALLKNTPMVADYYAFSFNSAVLRRRWDLLDSLVKEAEKQGHALFGKDRQADLKYYRDRMIALNKRDYAAMLGANRAQGGGPLDSAILYWLRGDSLRSRIAFHKASNELQKVLIQMKGSQDGNRYWILNTICLAALGIDGWLEEFAIIKRQLPGIDYPRYFNGIVIACLLAGEQQMAFKYLLEWKSENVPNPFANAYIHPTLTIFKDHALLDPIRNKPGFEDLWEGNHLKLKPLRIPKELLPK